MIYFLHIGLAITAFLMVLNGFLRGAKKHQIEAVLSLVLVGILLLAFVAFGWKAGLLAVFLAFVYGAVSRPIAGRIAARLMSLGGGPSGTHIGLPPRALERISRELGREVRPEDMLQEFMATPNRPQQAENALLDYCQLLGGIKPSPSGDGFSRWFIVTLWGAQVQLSAWPTYGL